MNWNGISVAVIGCLVAWRGLWLAAGVPDTTPIADDVRRDIETQLGYSPNADAQPEPEHWRVSFARFASGDLKHRASELIRSGADVWDASLPIWITPGPDQQPGWAGWDDNGDGVIDDSGELGAAWSDDRCVVEMPGAKQPRGRVIDHGAFRPLHRDGDAGTSRYRYRFQRVNGVYIRDAP